MNLLRPALTFALSFFVPAVLIAQTSPLPDSLSVIANGGREEIIGGNYGGLLTISKYFKGLEYAAHDTIVTVLGYTPDFFAGPVSAMR